MNELIKFPVADAAIAELSAKYMPLTVAGVEDKKGYALVREARLDIKDRRVQIEKTRKALKEDSLEFGRKVDGEAKRLTAELVKIETHLEAQEAIVTKEQERLKALEEEKKRLALQARVDAVDRVKKFVSVTLLAAMKEAEFAVFLKDAQDEYARKLKEEADAAEARKAEEAKLAAERAELAKQRAEAEAQAEIVREEQAAKEAAMRAELDAARKAQEEAAAKVREEQAAQQRKIDEERRQIELEKARKEAADKARIEAEQRAEREKKEESTRVERERQEAERQAKAEEAARKRAEALRPDREKLLSVAEDVENLRVPEVSEEAERVSRRISDLLCDCASNIREQVEELTAEVFEPAGESAGV